MIITREIYGSDRDNNRGYLETFWELEDTQDEREEIAELLFEYYLEGRRGLTEIDYKDITIEVNIEDYKKELENIKNNV